MELGCWNLFYLNSLNMCIEVSKKLHSQCLCNDCESGLRIELVKILKKLRTKSVVTLSVILVHFDLIPDTEFVHTYVVRCYQLSYGLNLQ